MKTSIDDAFREMLRLALSPSITPRTLMCVWGFHPFENRPNLIAEQLETNLGKLGQLHELFKLSTELVQIMASVSDQSRDDGLFHSLIALDVSYNHLFALMAITHLHCAMGESLISLLGGPIISIDLPLNIARTRV